jgi:hypothetical protein
VIDNFQAKAGFLNAPIAQPPFRRSTSSGASRPCRFGPSPGTDSPSSPRHGSSRRGR